MSHTPSPVHTYQRPDREKNRWREAAACAGADTDVFYRIGVRGINPAAAEAEAKAYCNRCTVLAECAAAADNWGLWAGLTELERHVIKRRADRAEGRRRRAAEAAEDAAVTAADKVPGRAYAKAGHVAPVPGMRRVS